PPNPKQLIPVLICAPNISPLLHPPLLQDFQHPPTLIPRRPLRAKGSLNQAHILPEPSILPHRRQKPEHTLWGKESARAVAQEYGVLVGVHHVRRDEDIRLPVLQL